MAEISHKRQKAPTVGLNLIVKSTIIRKDHTQVSDDDDDHNGGSGGGVVGSDGAVVVVMQYEQYFTISAQSKALSTQLFPCCSL